MNVIIDNLMCKVAAFIFGPVCAYTFLFISVSLANFIFIFFATLLFSFDWPSHKRV